jgi:heme-degrading monooxygenase HmoA
MIARFWHASTTREKADAFQEVLRGIVKKRNEIVSGYRGIYLLSKERDAKIEFVIVTMWDSIESIREFAGTVDEVAVVPAEIEPFLLTFDRHTSHYQVLWQP